ncbi:hypothetical protein ADIARSV_2468 [Arcticibacter svalbardensis MN12-7]|uniref:PRC-barrel domain-containing protein n=1 Tax=Arcticibacter svalbardensis MN12-7 TaxID=1150600 RepID=R9GRN4_9SPHI|nr:PRC-barrel domain-containing protein [Arcticibacter svalbardensis]EOR94386.1 hypothetical protein ADIARSV_2468 [Arcticibacter svalbardensis MN12-7]
MALDDQINENSHLVELGGSDFEIVDGQPNVNGWDVVNEHGHKIGEVAELLFSPESRKVRYLVVDLDDTELSMEDNEPVEKKDGPILIPIGLAELHEQDDEVIVPHVTTAQIMSLPAYEKGNVTPITESQIRSILAGTTVGDALAYNAADFYTHDHFNEEKFYGNRRVPQENETVPIDQSHDQDPSVLDNEDIGTKSNSETLDDLANSESNKKMGTSENIWETADENLIDEDNLKDETRFGAINEDEEDSKREGIRFGSTNRGDSGPDTNINPL